MDRRIAFGWGLVLWAIGCSSSPVDGGNVGSGGSGGSGGGPGGQTGPTTSVGTGGSAAGGDTTGATTSTAGGSGGDGGSSGFDAAGGAKSDAAVDSNRPSDGDAGSVGLSDGGYEGADKLACSPGTEGDGKQNLVTGLQTDPPEWKLGTGVQAGPLAASMSFASKIYGQHFPYRVYASANVVKGQPSVFMTFGDGGTYISGFHLPTVLDNLTAAGDVPPTIVLFIDPPSDGDRVQTYDPPTDKYARFLMEEIVPAVIDPTYTISKDPAAWATGGYSASAEQGWTVLWKTDRFHKFFGHNSSFGAAPTYGVDWPKTVAAAPPRDLRVSLVNADVGKDLVDNRGDWTLINQAMATALESKGNPYRFIIGPGDHGGPAGQRDFPTALRWMFRGCKFARM